MPRVRMSVVPEIDDSVEISNFHSNPTYESTLNINYKVEENIRSCDQELDRLSHREMIRRSIQLPERGPIRKPRVRMSVVPDINVSGESGNCHINPTFESNLYVNFNEEDNVRSGDRENDRLSHREMIRRSIQLPERGPIRKPHVRMSVVPDIDDSEESGNCHINPTFESNLYVNFNEENNVRSGDRETDRLSHREMIRRNIQLPESRPMPELHVRMSNVPETDDSEESGNYYINPTFESDLNINCKVEENLRSGDRELDRLSYREIIRRSIQLPEILPTSSKLCRCKILDKDHKEQRLFAAYILLIFLFVMTFGSIGLTIIIQTIPLKFCPDCWMLTVALASLTSLIGVYICWENEICRTPRPRQERIFIDIDLAAFA